MGRAVGFLISLISFLLLIFCFLTVFLGVGAERDFDGTMIIFGYQARIVLSDSMAKCEHTDVSGYDIKDIPVKSMIFIDTLPKDEAEADRWYASLREGDVLTFRYTYATTETVTHRITGIAEKADGGYIITLQGDNRSETSGTLTQIIDTSDISSPNRIIGKVVGKSYVLGVISYEVRNAFSYISSMLSTGN